MGKGRSRGGTDIPRGPVCGVWDSAGVWVINSLANVGLQPTMNRQPVHR
jgi:hypothetical protein